VTLTMNVHALSEMENTELAAALDRLRAAKAQIERDIAAIEAERDRRIRTHDEPAWQ
jgi:hypothetical protein